MTYSTGAGDYNALMAAVLAHAVTDGWTTSAGNWPISKGVVRGVAWATFTATEVDRTALGGATKTARYLRIAVGTSGANATANAASDATSAQMANAEYTFTSWHIFSDPTVSDHIHVVVNFSNGVNGDCYAHFSFGALDKRGMTYTGVAYATASPKRGYSSAATGSLQAYIDYNGGPGVLTTSPYTGKARSTSGPNYNGRNQLVYIIDPTVSPLPGAGWPTVNTVNDDLQIFNVLSPHSGLTSTQFGPGMRSVPYSLAHCCWFAFTSPHPYSGAISMGPLPFLLLQNLTSTGQVMYLGDFPNVRTCSMESYAPQSIVTYGADEWMLFPMLRSTPWSQIQTSDLVSSGRSGYAFKKVP